MDQEACQIQRQEYGRGFGWKKESKSRSNNNHSNPEEGTSYVDVIKKVWWKVNLQETGVDVQRTRLSKYSANLLEVKDREEADLLTERFKSVIGDHTYVSRPSRSTKCENLGEYCKLVE